jgi:hypothetical protein
LTAPFYLPENTAHPTRDHIGATHPGDSPKQSSRRTVAALYIDPRGPYPELDGVDCWDEERDARKYDGPHPVVAHPPCGPWSKLRHLCNEATLATTACGPLAVKQVRALGGVLEHPAHSRLFALGALGRQRSLPLPTDGTDSYGGFTLLVNQVAWGHCCAKPTWLYCVGIDRRLALEGIRTGGTPTHCICTGPRQLKRLPVASKQLKRRTPPLFAQWLVDLARSAK